MNRLRFDDAVPEREQRRLERVVDDLIYAARTYKARHPDRPDLVVEVIDHDHKPRRAPMQRLGAIIDRYRAGVGRDDVAAIHGALLGLLSEVRATLPMVQGEVRH